MGKKFIITLIKFTFIIFALWLVFVNSDFSTIIAKISSADLVYLGVAVVFLNLAQIASGFRMRYYFSQQGLFLSRKFSIALYYIGMFYNNILPSGIGGDGYKVFLLKKERQFPAIDGVKVLVSERANGLLVLLLLLLLFLLFSNYNAYIPTLAIVILFPTVILGYFVATHVLFKEHVKHGVCGGGYSFIVQGFTTLSALFLLLSLGADEFILEYMILFLIASVLGVLPISIGGLGIRELTYLYGEEFLPINAELGIAFALCFWCMYLISSFIGVIFIANPTKLAYQ